MPYSSLGRPATALSPMLGMVAPLKTHTSSPSGVRTTFGARSRYAAGMWPSNRSRGFDQVVVDADEDQVGCVHGGPPGMVGDGMNYSSET